MVNLNFRCQHAHSVWTVFDEWNLLIGVPADTSWAVVAKCTRLGYHRGQHKDEHGNRWY